MASHAPLGYDCPFCRVVAGDRSDRSGPEHVLHRYARALLRTRVRSTLAQPSAATAVHLEGGIAVQAAADPESR